MRAKERDHDYDVGRVETGDTVRVSTGELRFRRENGTGDYTRSITGRVVDTDAEGFTVDRDGVTFRVEKGNEGVTLSRLLYRAGGDEDWGEPQEVQEITHVE